MAISDGDKVTLDYTGKLQDGQVFDTSEGRGPLTFQVGAGEVIPGFEEGVRGLDVGEKTTVEIPPEQGYGERREELVRTVPREAVQGTELEIGQVLGLQDEQGQQFQARVAELEDEEVTLDFNHMLAGEKLMFDIEIVSVEDGEGGIAATA